MIPLFKSHYSIGKSILTLNHPDKVKEGSSDSVFSIINKDQKQVVLVEDSLIGFLQSQKVSKELGLQLIFGLRMSCSHETNPDIKNGCTHKVIIFAKNDGGCKLLNTIYSHAFCKNDGILDLKFLGSTWEEDSLSLAIPFYDSFIYMNSLHFCSCVPNFSFTKPTFFIENNFLPFDEDIKNKVLDYCKKYNLPHSLTKTIYYNKRDDFAAYQTYKCICSKKFKQRTLNVPNFDHLASPEFSYESYLEHEST
jgi:DNA polymerase III alpha subunit